MSRTTVDWRTARSCFGLLGSVETAPELGDRPMAQHPHVARADAEVDANLLGGRIVVKAHLDDDPGGAARASPGNDTGPRRRAARTWRRAGDLNVGRGEGDRATHRRACAPRRCDRCPARSDRRARAPRCAPRGPPRPARAGPLARDRARGPRRADAAGHRAAPAARTVGKAPSRRRAPPRHGRRRAERARRRSPLERLEMAWRAHEQARQ